MKNLKATKVRTSPTSESTEFNLPANHMEMEVFYQDTLVKRRMSTEEWTNEKHSLYLKYMEATFVNQLYDSKQMLGLCSPEATFSRSTTTTSGQLKVVGDGRWSRSNEYHDLKANPWIHHLRCSSKDGRVSSAVNVVEDSVSSTSEVSGLNQRRKRNPTASPHLHLCHRHMIFSHREMSDQNFVDEEVVCQKGKRQKSEIFNV